MRRDYVAEPVPPSALADAPVADMAKKLDVLAQMKWHRAWEGLPLKFTVWTIIAVASASLFEIVPTFAIKSNVPTIASVKPYTPLELAGRAIEIALDARGKDEYGYRSEFVQLLRRAEVAEAMAPLDQPGAGTPPM